MWERRAILIGGVALIILGGSALGAEEAAGALAGHLAAMKDVKTLAARFVCEKRLAMLETPLVSEGRLWIAKGDGGRGGGVRFSTEKPYVSELVLADGKVHQRSQHETKWVTTKQGSRPGLTTVMGQLGGWSTGEASRLGENYEVKWGAGSVPVFPNGPDIEYKADMFELTPKDAQMAATVLRIVLGMDRVTHELLYVEVVTRTGKEMDDGATDMTRYWFRDVRLNGELPAGVFEARELEGGGK